tara:strand:- start:927 stop:1148 length:222 start_codon:yes stop_codon:yes gene_type:complete
MSDLFDVVPLRSTMGRSVTKTSLTSTGTGSLRTTVPSWIVKQFNLMSGEKIAWELKVENESMIIQVFPASKGE